MPLDSLNDGDGQLDSDVQTSRAVSIPTPAPKRGRSRKAILEVMPNANLPSGTLQSQIPPTAGGGGQLCGDAHSVPVSPNSSSPRKRGRPRKATDAVMPKRSPPPWALDSEMSRETAAGGGQVRYDTHGGSAPASPQIGGVFAVAERMDPKTRDTHAAVVHPSAPHSEMPVPEPVGGGQIQNDVHTGVASPSTNTAVSVTDVDGGGEVRANAVLMPIECVPDLAPLIEDLITLQKDRVFWLRCRNRHNNATVAYVRRRLNWDPGAPEAERKKINARALSIVSKVEKGLRLPDEDREIGVKCADIILTAAKAREPIDIALKGVSKKDDPNGVGKLGIEQLMEMRAKQLPVWEWVEEVRGLGALGLAVIVGETGNLSNYANPGKVWKRLGLAPYKGKSAKTWRSEGGLTAEEWKMLGYSPCRRSEMWNRAVPLIKTQVRQVKDDDGKDTGDRQSLGPYGQVYLDRKKYEIDRDPNISKLWAHARAQHYMEKRLIKHLWQVWIGQPVVD